MSRRHHQGGFALAEMMAGVAVVAVVMTAATAMIFDSINSFSKLIRYAQLHQEVRSTFDLLWLGAYRTGVNSCTVGNGKCSEDGSGYHNYSFGLVGRTNQTSTGSGGEIVSTSIYFNRTAETATDYWKYPSVNFNSSLSSLNDHIPAAENRLMAYRDRGANKPVPLYYLSFPPSGFAIDKSPAATEIRAAVINPSSAVNVICIDNNGYPLIRGCGGTTKAMDVYGYLADDPVISNNNARVFSISVPMIDMFGLESKNHRATPGNGTNLIDVYKFYLWTTFVANTENSSTN